MTTRNPVLETAAHLHRWRHDPLLCVQEAYPWGRGELATQDGPDVWQRDILAAIRDGLSVESALQIAVASGHGAGKSGLVAWIILWALGTEVDCRGIVTANTEVQLKTKTWPELGKWYRLGPLWQHLFHFAATSIYSIDPKHERTWRIDMVPWSEVRTEAFAGLHNQGRRLIAIFDEASSIPDIIWETTEGALTDANTEILWLVCGNPTRNTGRFRECFGRLKHRWLTRQIDSRTAKLTNKAQIAEWVEDYGEDSDFVRVRVRGVFPRAGTLQFISSEVVEAAMRNDRDPPVTLYDPLVMGVDVARFGSNESVICFRRGRDARTIPWRFLRGVDTMQLAAVVTELAMEHQPDAIFVDGGGVGGGVVDRLRYLRQNVTEVQFGGVADRSMGARDQAIVYANKRAEMWGSMREWLEGGAIPNDNDLAQQLVGVQYGYVLRNGRDAIQLERKVDMERRGLQSCDRGDALALCFAYPVAPSDHTSILSKKPVHEIDYDPMAEARVIAPLMQRR